MVAGLLHNGAEGVSSLVANCYRLYVKQHPSTHHSFQDMNHLQPSPDPLHLALGRRNITDRLLVCYQRYGRSTPQPLQQVEGARRRGWR